MNFATPVPVTSPAAFFQAGASLEEGGGSLAQLGLHAAAGSAKLTSSSPDAGGQAAACAVQALMRHEREATTRCSHGSIRPARHEPNLDRSASSRCRPGCSLTADEHVVARMVLKQHRRPAGFRTGRCNSPTTGAPTCVASLPLFVAAAAPDVKCDPICRNEARRTELMRRQGVLGRALLHAPRMRETRYGHDGWHRNHPFGSR
jgi:hypothetical protein